MIFIEKPVSCRAAEVHKTLFAVSIMWYFSIQSIFLISKCTEEHSKDHWSIQRGTKWDPIVSSELVLQILSTYNSTTFGDYSKLTIAIRSIIYEPHIYQEISVK